jgi:hypothetical protein
MVFNAPFFPLGRPELSHPYADILQACYNAGYTHHRIVLAAIIAHAANLIDEHHGVEEIDDQTYVFVEKVANLCGWIANLCSDRPTIEKIWKIVEVHGLSPLEAGVDVDKISVADDDHATYYTLTCERLYGRLFEAMSKQGIASCRALPMAMVLHVGALNIYNASYIDADFVKIFESATPNILRGIAELVERRGL